MVMLHNCRVIGLVMLHNCRVKRAGKEEEIAFFRSQLYFFFLLFKNGKSFIFHVPFIHLKMGGNKRHKTRDKPLPRNIILYS